ncbi:hypothetical protein ACF05T_21185 [Streptomyces lateritius]|uniref:Uncharacterized protein n=1 Tax=Streptomyces lateritius TaxID=67313 RepID=A0ABW6YGD3_9ACTN
MPVDFRGTAESVIGALNPTRGNTCANLWSPTPDHVLSRPARPPLPGGARRPSARSDAPSYAARCNGVRPSEGQVREADSPEWRHGAA